MSQRRMALVLGVNRKTIARKIEFLGLKSKASRWKWLKRYKEQPATEVLYDDMETFEHSKCKPVAISLLVEAKTRKILDFEVSQMAAKGRLAAVSRKKYGRRKDHRKRAWNRIFLRSKEHIAKTAVMKSDELSMYRPLVRKHFPHAEHIAYKGRLGCVVGQGELKRGGFDPLFDLNHTCAMVRDGLGRLVRRTWCTSKKLENLRLQLEIYVNYHNRKLT